MNSSHPNYYENKEYARYVHGGEALAIAIIMLAPMRLDERFLARHRRRAGAICRWLGREK